MIFGVMISILEFIFNLFILHFGLKEKDISIILEQRFRLLITGAIIELSYVIWAFINLPRTLFLSMLLVEISASLMHILKLEGSKFIMFVIVPAFINVLVIYGLVLIY